MVFLSTLSLAGSAAAGDSLGPATDPSTGEIDGQAALAIFPARFEGRSAVEMLESDDCWVSLIARSDGAVYRRPCGEWITVPPDVYEYWAESPGKMSPYARRVAYAGEEFSGRGMRGAAPMQPAGTVEVDSAGSSAPTGAELRVIHAELPVADRTLLRASVQRTLPLPTAGPFQMPVGLNLSAIWDPTEARYLRISRPFRVSEGQSAVVPWSDPAPDRSHLLARIERHRNCATTTEDSLRLVLAAEAGRRPPDLQIVDRSAAVAVWYDVPEGDVEVHASASGGVMEPLRLRLAGGLVERAVGSMEVAPEDPSLDIELELPDSLRTEPLSLEIRGMPDRKILESVDVGQFDWSFRFPGMPRSVVEAQLTTSLGTYSRHIDLSSGDDGLLRLVVDPIEIEGRVSMGGEGVPAEMTFTTIRRQTLKVSSTQDGRYRLVSVEPIRSVSIQVQSYGADEGEESGGVAGDLQPFVEFFADALAEDTQRDFEIPDLRYEIRVVDGRTGRPVGQARVVSRNEYYRDAEERDGEPSMAVMQQVTTDDEGRVLLPPLRPGRLQVTASADGYVRMTEPVVAEVFEDMEQQALELRLEPFGESIRLQIRDSQGAPARGASVALADASGNILMETSSDSAGEAELAREEMAVWALARHAGSAFAVRNWPPDEPADHAVAWRLDRPAPPLAIRLVSAFGDQPVRHGRLAIWFEGVLLPDSVLHWLTGQKPFADSNGYWSADNLPNQSLSVVGWSPDSESAAQNSRLPSMATPLAPPWPGRVTIEVLE